MTKSMVIGIAFSAILINGCAKTMFNAPTADWPWEKNFPCENTCTAKEAIDAFTEANEFCRDVQNFYESGGQRSNNTKLAIGTVGTIAGSVIAPISNDTAAKAWSGLSGAANAFQTAMDEAFSVNIAIRRRKAVADAAAKGSEEFKKSQNPTERIVIAVDMARDCATSPAKADHAIFSAISQ
uniref:Uncharacterized protein n=1 Tax=Candidatus Kentrum sp. TC TaxID=2126339 RepID=A0A450YR28_9GAMM|nr:MAG: hypothetical protein BECKTC1821E_GA0114239_103023 [Candidatus Kentron sp. TC]